MKAAEKLRPTLWRTCRALLNGMRLRMLKLALEGEGALCVRDYAKMLSIPDSIASIYLRQMNARGLLGVTRDRIKVFYNGNQDASLPDSILVQKALRDYFAKGAKKGWESEIMTILRAFSHFNRLAILVRLSEGPATMSELFDSMGVCVKSVYHHLGFLHAAGLLTETRKCRRPSVFTLVEPVHPVCRVLLSLVRAGAREGRSYYNGGSGRRTDRASRATLKKISKAEGSSRATWKKRGPKRDVAKKMPRHIVSALEDDEK